MKVLYAVSLIFGILAVLFSVMHGVGELQQEGSPSSVMINAWLVSASGTPPVGEGACDEAGECLPAMTILTFLPFQVIGILTIVFSLVLGMIVVQTYREAENGVPDVPNTAPPPLKSIPYKRGQHIVIGSILILLIGGGFFAPILGLISALARFLGSRK